MFIGYRSQELKHSNQFPVARHALFLGGLHHTFLQEGVRGGDAEKTVVHKILQVFAIFSTFFPWVTEEKYAGLGVKSALYD